MEREAFRLRMQQYKLARESNPLLKYWDWKSTIQREPLDGVYEDARFIDQSEPRFELRKGQQHYAKPVNLRLMKGLGRAIKVLGPVGEFVQNVFPSEEAEALEDARVRYENALKPQTYAEGGIVDEDPPASERPITNFNPKGDPYQPLYGYNPGAGYTKGVLDLYDAPVIGDAMTLYDAGKAVYNKDWVGAGLASLSALPFVPTSAGRTVKRAMSGYIPEVTRTASAKINALLNIGKSVDDKLGKPVIEGGLRRVPYENAIEARNRVYETVLDPENIRRAKDIDRKYGTKYEQVYKEMDSLYLDPMSYFSLTYEPVMDTTLDFDTKALISANPKDRSIKLSKGVNSGLYDVNTGLIRHEIGHKVDIGATGGHVKTNEFMRDLTKDIIPYQLAKYLLNNVKDPRRTYMYLTNPSEVKSHMNLFRLYLIDLNIMKPTDKVENVPNFFMHLQAAPDEFNGIKLLLNLFKTDRAFKKRFNQIPLTNISDNKVRA